MGFLTPWFLAGVVGVGLPIWLHLLKRHKSDPRPFPSLMFFERREQSSVVHRRLDHILLFILRTLMLVLLALLFANPFINRTTPKAAGKKMVVVAVDDSFSMRAAASGTSGESRLDKAKREALDIISGIPATTAAEVVALGGTVQAMTQQTTDPAELRGAVAAIKPSDSRASFGELARFTRTLAESSKMPIDVHLVSDLQKSAMPPGFTDLRLTGDTTLILHPVGGEIPNWTVENVKAPIHVYDPKRVRIQATIAGFGTPAATRTVSLVLNGKVVQSKPVDVPAAADHAPGRAQVEFNELAASYGPNRCEVRIDSADALPGDDGFPFSVERADPKKILFIDNGRHPYAEKYYRTALDSSTDAAFVLDPQRPETAATANLAGYSLIVLDDLGPLPPGLEENLQRYVNPGKSLLVVLGPASVAMPKVPVEGDPIQPGASYAARETERFLTVSDIDSGHPMMKGLERLEGVSFYQAVRVAASKDAHVIAKLNDQTPLLLERPIGQGKVMVFTSTFDNVSNDLPVHGAYWVPFVLQSATYLGGGGAEQPVNVAVDSYVELRTGESKNTAAEVLDQDGKRALSLEEATTAKTYQLTREGFFDVKTASGQRSLIAAHADRRESDLTVIPQDALDLWKGTGSGGAGSDGAGGTADQKTTPWSLSPLLLLLLLLVALAESVVANGYLRAPEERQEGARKEAA
jgi:aerotolerance regulator-like protein/VWA domain-containing protein